MKPTTPTARPTEQLINELQSFGVRLVDPKAGHESRRGGAGPSDHKAITIDGMTVMVPVNSAYTGEEVSFVVNDSDAQFVIVDHAFLDTVRNMPRRPTLLADANIVVHGAAEPEGMPSADRHGAT